LEAFIADPTDRWIALGSSVVWCASPSLGGSATWGRPNASHVVDVIRCYEALWSKALAERVDVILDARRTEGVDPDALATIVSWVLENRERIAKRIRVQIGVIPSGVHGITLAGILPALGETHAFRVERESIEAFRALAGADGDRLSEEVDALVREASGVSPELAALRDLVRERHASLTVEEAARALKSSTRSLQRILQTHGTSFQDEVRSARFERASELLRSTDDKVTTIAARVGITEGALTQLFRERTGSTPTEFRKNRAT
jgi:AraC-like DNA-binding protein